jgi:hypothetical protein
MTKFILTVMLLLPHVLFANTECWLEEYPDHYVAECMGDKISEPDANPSSITSQSAKSIIPATQAQPTGLIQATKKAPWGETISMGVESSYRPTRMSKARLNAAIIVRNKLLQQDEYRNNQSSNTP